MAFAFFEITYSIITNLKLPSILIFAYLIITELNSTGSKHLKKQGTGCSYL